MDSTADIVKAGDYIIIQRQDYFKLHKISPNGTVNLGKDVLDIGTVVGKPVWTTFRMEQKKGGKRNYQLKECSVLELKDDSITLSDTSVIPCGTDNRNIIDDGSSQKLSMEEIVNLRDEGLSSKEIVGTLIENSKTFHSKTEYSQQKYLKKKEKKYFEYITVRKPTLRLIAEVMFRLDQGKIMSLRMDTLSQLSTALNLHSHGKYILYESGCQGLAAATILNGLSGDGRLVLVHPGNYPQKQAVLALNPTEEQEHCLISVNIYNLLRKLKANSPSSILTIDEPEISSNLDDSKKGPAELKISNIQHTLADTLAVKTEVPIAENTAETETNSTSSLSDEQEPVNSDQENSCPGKRKHSESGNDDGSAKKKSRWEVETDKAVRLLGTKADGLVLVCREHPSAILKALLPFVAPSRNIVVYSQFREPLQELFLELRERSNIINLKLTDTWLRHYQVESNRTHPLVNMTGSGGYLLTGIVVEKT